MRSEALISIIVPVYNRAELVKATLNSIARQTLRPIDVILVDNNSSDNTLDVLNRWKEANETGVFKVTVLQECKPGAPAARNRGLAAVSTPFTMFFDSDDTMSPTHVERVLKVLAGNALPDIVGWKVNVKRLDGSIGQYKFCDKDVLYNHIFHATLATQRIAARTELFRNVGGWNESLMGWNDYELGIRLLAAKPKIASLEGKPTVTVVLQEQSITGTDFSSKPQYWENALCAIESALADNNLHSMIKYIDVRRVILAAFYAREGADIDAQRLLNEVLSKGGLYRNLIMRFFYLIIKRGGRGIAFIARPLLCFTR